MQSLKKGIRDFPNKSAKCLTYCVSCKLILPEVIRYAVRMSDRVLYGSLTLCCTSHTKCCTKVICVAVQVIWNAVHESDRVLYAEMKKMLMKLK